LESLEQPASTQNLLILIKKCKRRFEFKIEGGMYIKTSQCFL